MTKGSDYVSKIRNEKRKYFLNKNTNERIKYTKSEKNKIKTIKIEEFNELIENKGLNI
jgi:sulfur transfer complex TusBCD TusB component (DsrH family)